MDFSRSQVMFLPPPKEYMDWLRGQKTKKNTWVRLLQGEAKKQYSLHLDFNTGLKKPLCFSSKIEELCSNGLGNHYNFLSTFKQIVANMGLQIRCP